jgi:hypothetical protein
MVAAATGATLTLRNPIQRAAATIWVQFGSTSMRTPSIRVFRVVAAQATLIVVAARGREAVHGDDAAEREVKTFARVVAEALAGEAPK